MSDSITIFEKEIPFSEKDMNIDKLKFSKDNPRVFSFTQGDPDFESLADEQKQEKIYDKLLKEPSVKNLIPDIRKHGGLMEPILVRADRWEVVEGNSRLAVYRKLYKETQDEKWEYVKCKLVSSLTEEQQAAYLSQIHVKGKTPWSAYEKANLAYNLSQRHSPREVAKMTGEHFSEINKRIKVVEMMKENKDADRSHFSYYDVLVRGRAISKEIAEDPQLKEFLLEQIKKTKAGEENQIADSENFPTAAVDLRKKLDVIIKNTEAKEKLVGGEYNFDRAYNKAKFSGTEEKIKKALSYLEEIKKVDIILEEHVNNGSLNKIEDSVRKLEREVDRLNGIIHEIKRLEDSV